MTPKEILATVLDADHVDAFLAHRKSRRAPLTTELAARIIVKRLVSPEIRAYFPDPNLAIEEIIERGWQTIKAEWLAPRQNGRAALPARGLAAAREQLAEELFDAHRSPEPQDGDHHNAGGIPIGGQLRLRLH